VGGEQASGLQKLADYCKTWVRTTAPNSHLSFGPIPPSVKLGGFVAFDSLFVKIAGLQP